jgi:hypothetical protein
MAGVRVRNTADKNISKSRWFMSGISASSRNGKITTISEIHGKYSISRFTAQKIAIIITAQGKPLVGPL